MQEVWVQSLGQEDPLKKEMATHSSIPVRKILWTEEPAGLQSMGSLRELEWGAIALSIIGILGCPKVQS